MKQLVVAFLLVATLFAENEQNTTTPFDIDKEIEKIMQAPPQQRRLLMNELKRKIFKLNLEIQSSQITNLQRLLNMNTHQRGHR